MVTVKLRGNWVALQNKMNKLSDMTGSEVKKAVKKSADDMHLMMLNAIDNQTYPWARLSDATIKRKGHSKVFYETGQVYRGLQTHELINETLRYQIFIGAPDHLPHFDENGKVRSLSEIVAAVEDNRGRRDRLLMKTTFERSQDSFKLKVDKAIKGLL